jgi:uncharacterized SAM-binding protein YcdF (DUF218 family)
MTVKRIGRRLLILLVVLALMCGAAFWAFRNVGRWLVRPDPLQPARAVVVLSGRTPFRALEAAEIYKQGWAPEIWLLRDLPDEGEREFARLGVHYIPEEDYNQQVLEKLGVPAKAIRPLGPPTTNTANEAEQIAVELRRLGGDKVILVTSPVHTRRLKAIWRLVVGDHPQAIVRDSPAEPSDPDHWWRTTGDVQAVVHELLGLVNAWLGFVVKPR